MVGNWTGRAGDALARSARNGGAGALQHAVRDHTARRPGTDDHVVATSDERLAALALARRFNHRVAKRRVLAEAAAPGTEEREADEPKGRVVVGPVQLVEVCPREHPRGDQAVPKELVGHLGEPRGRVTAPPGQ